MTVLMSQIHRRLDDADSGFWPVLSSVLRMSEKSPSVVYVCRYWLKERLASSRIGNETQGGEAMWSERTGSGDRCQRTQM